MKPPYYLLEDGKPTGPHSLLVLHQKAEIRVIGPDSSVRPVSPADAPWLPIRALPELHALLFPPKPTPVLSVRRAAAATHPPFPPADEPIEVARMLEDNTARLAATERFKRSAWPGRRARRHRAYLLTVATFAAPAWAAYRFNLLPHTDVTVVVLASVLGLVALLGYWMIYHITDFGS